MHGSIAFQGMPGAYSHLACLHWDPERPVLPCALVADAFEAVVQGKAAMAMLPVENSQAGRVADIYRLMPDQRVAIIGEHFEPIHHCLLALPGTPLSAIRTAISHPQALAQCKGSLERLGIQPQVHTDTAASAHEVSVRRDRSLAAVASTLAARTYGLDVLVPELHDAWDNTTRFLVLAREPNVPPLASGPVLTTCLFRVRNLPAALYKALGGFATNGVNLVKLESYTVGGTFQLAQFHIDFEGHPEDPAVMRALDELRYFASEVRMLGTYPVHPHRRQGR